MDIRSIPWLGAPLNALSASRQQPVGDIVVYYDGECGFCNQFIQRLMRIGVPPNVQFASQQGEHWQELIARRPDLAHLNTVVITHDHDGKQDVYIRSEAVFWLMAQLGGAYRLAWMALLVPLPLLNLGYRTVAANRGYLSKLTGQQCALPTPEMRQRFLD